MAGSAGRTTRRCCACCNKAENPPDYIHLLNPDAIIEPGAISALLDVIDADPKIGAVASQLEPDGRIAGSAFGPVARP